MDDTEESSDSLIAECKTKNKMYTNAQPESPRCPIPLRRKGMNN